MNPKLETFVYATATTAGIIIGLAIGLGLFAVIVNFLFSP